MKPVAEEAWSPDKAKCRDLCLALAPCALRTIVGIAAGSLFGVIGLVLGWMVWPPPAGADYLFYLRIFGLGIGAGIGGFLGWLDLEQDKPTVFLFLVLALLGAVGGAFGGRLYGLTATEGIQGPISATQSGTLRTVLGAVIGANILPLIVSLYRVARHRKS